jgi:major intracellular serine protease
MRLGINVAAPDTIGEDIPKGVELIHAPETWPITKGKDARIGLLSTGIYTPHEDLNVVESVSFSTVEPDPQDFNGHGTNMAGLIAARGNGRGIVGVAPEASLVSVKVLSSSGSGTLEDIARALTWCLSAKLDVIVLDFGGGGLCDPKMQGLIGSLTKMGSVVVCGQAEINDYPITPGSCGSVISVAARPSKWSPDKADLRSWAGRMKTTEAGGGYSWQFFSMQAVALVAGAVALVKGVASNMNVDDVRKLLSRTSDDVDPGHYPYRQVNVFRAINEIIRP